MFWKMSSLEGKILIESNPNRSNWNLDAFEQPMKAPSYHFAVERSILCAAIRSTCLVYRKGGDATGGKLSSSSNPSIRVVPAQIVKFELFELILSLRLGTQFPVEQFEARRAIRVSSISVSSTLPPSSLRLYEFSVELFRVRV